MERGLYRLLHMKKKEITKKIVQERNELLIMVKEKEASEENLTRKIHVIKVKLEQNIFLCWICSIFWY